MIELYKPDLTAKQKKEVKSEFLNYSKTVENNEFEIHCFRNILSKGALLVKSPSVKKRNLSIFVIAISIHLGLPKKLHFHSEKDKYLVASLMYFIDPDDVIPDHVPYTGYDDDTHCIELALKKVGDESNVRIYKIANLVNDLGVEKAMEEWKRGPS